MVKRMYYSYTMKEGLNAHETRQEAIATINGTVATIEKASKEIATRINKKNKYCEYNHQYEAILLYIIRRGNEEYPEYLTKTRIGQVFTLAMLRWYNHTDRSYTHEKPILAGRIQEYGGEVGFKAFRKYYDNIKQHLHTRENKNGWYVVWTEIPTEYLVECIGDKQMLKIVNWAIRDCKYNGKNKPIIRKINQAYRECDSRWKQRRQTQ